MHTQRLAILAKHLRTIHKTPPRQFDMDRWLAPSGWPGPSGCRTSACAGGEASLIPEFRALGLQPSIEGLWGPPAFQGEKGAHALAAFFEISYAQSLSLFGSHSYADVYPITALHVAERIEEMLVAAAPPVPTLAHAAPPPLDTASHRLAPLAAANRRQQPLAVAAEEMA